MRGYKLVQEKSGWRFDLIPSNNHQPVGWSKLFDTYEGCVEGLKMFRELVITNAIDTLDSPFVRVIYGEKGAYFEYCIDDTMIFRSREYFTSYPRNSCKKSISSIYQRFDEYTTNRITEGKK